jgi:lysophospholipase L1-like esterase
MERITRHLAFMERAQSHKSNVLFLGDSITDSWRDRPEVFAKDFPRAANFGVGFDKIQSVLWRVQNGEVEGVHPDTIVLLVGANNIETNSESEIVAGIDNLVRAIQSKQQGVKIILIGLLPTDWLGGDLDGPNNVLQINARLANLKGVTFVDFGAKLLKPDGTFNDETQPDHLHLSSRGYKIWADAIMPIITQDLAGLN